MCNQLKEADPSAMSDLFFNLSDKVCLCSGKAGIHSKHSNLVYADIMVLKAFECILYSSFIMPIRNKHALVMMIIKLTLTCVEF